MTKPSLNTALRRVLVDLKQGMDNAEEARITIREPVWVAHARLTEIVTMLEEGLYE